jgi:hypothetical protein
MKADQNSHLMAYIIQDVLKDAIHRAGEKGGGRRNAAVLSLSIRDQ